MTRLSVPVAGCMRWGKWGAGFSTNEYRQMIDACLENGITSFDQPIFMVITLQKMNLAKY